MSKYLEYFNGVFDSTVVDKMKPENRPYVAYSGEDGKVVYSNPLPKYLCFEPIDENGNQLAVIKLSDHNNTQYSFDKVTWTEFPTDLSDPQNPVFITVDKPIYLKSNNPKGYTLTETGIGSKIVSTGKYNVSGDVTTLLNEVGNVKDLSDCNPCCLAMLFGKIDPDDMGIDIPAIDIVDASKLILPATTLIAACYLNMFSGCISLTTAPELPATTLAYGCYNSMFSGCTSLTTAPEILPATELAESCYYEMFRDCTSLTTAPELPATTLAEGCYYYMFSGCISLTTAPELPATTLAYGCYNSMFRDCSSLTTAPSILPATELADYCYQYMFYGCTSLTTAPKLPATELAEGCYYYMFNGCTALTAAPELPATILTTGCYISMFSDCTSLITAPSILPATELAKECYWNMFGNCTSLTTAPELPATTLVERCYEYMFSDCTSLNYIKCLATDRSALYCTQNWISNVSNTGTFVKHPDATWYTGSECIPSGWTIEDAVL